MAVTAKFPTNVPTPDANRSDSGIWKYSEGNHQVANANIAQNTND